MSLDARTYGRLIWTMLALVVCLWRGPVFLRNLRPPPTLILDFFQEWASARNRLEGLAVYTPQAITAARYLGFERAADELHWNEYNAHPPTSVLLVLPLAKLDYADAFFAWSLLSLAALGVSAWIVVRQLPGVLTPWSVLPLCALLLLCNPFRQQMNQGQLNLVLLLLLTGAWALDRSGRPWSAGALVGIAAAVKLFPGFLLLYFVARRLWRPVAAAAAAFVALTGLTVAVLGPDCYRDYLTVVLPSLDRYRAWWPNVSLAGFWHKLFNADGVHVISLWQNPPLAWAATLLSDAVVTALTGWLVWRSARSLPRPRGGEGDLAFALTVTAMLLVSPITWDHYFTLLFLPLVLLWAELPPGLGPRLAFWAVLVALWITPLTYWALFIRGVAISNWVSRTATPAQAVTALSIQTYALLALFVLAARFLYIRQQGEAWRGARESR